MDNCNISFMKLIPPISEMLIYVGPGKKKKTSVMLDLAGSKCVHL